MHNVQPNQKVRILQVEIAVPANAEDSEVRDEISALLTEAGLASPESHLLDWRYTGIERSVIASDDPHEEAIFTSNAGNMELPGAIINRVRPMSFDEAQWLFWEYSDHLPMVIELNDGKVLFPSQDSEGNGPGCLMAMVYQNGQFRDDTLFTYD
jgi:hypothetical protein